MIKDKCVQMYNEFITQLHMYAEAVRVLEKRVFTNFACNSIKIERNFGCSENHEKKKQVQIMI